MKKILLSITVFISFCACRKDRTCLCSQNGTEVSKSVYTHVKKSEAKTYCQAAQNTYGTSSGITCVVQ